MALAFIPNLNALSTMLLMVLAVTTSLVLASHEVKETQLSFYFQDIFAGPNATDIPFAGISGKAWTFTQFATLYAIDDPVTEGSHPNSASVGRVQGTSMTSALDGLNAHVLFSIVFTNKKYNGTGKFRFVRGYITFETISVDIPNSYAVIRCNVTKPLRLEIYAAGLICVQLSAKPANKVLIRIKTE
ncbi:unnamed protein product [Prunus armeniaca]|uniref:Dirigent protein n=1 Tax=Prunus armeniaca TaxID=36596 RepID=A0A6J5WX85_PRUAR|nr:unnamed protein product [Prunus armeniaca]